MDKLEKNQDMLGHATFNHNGAEYRVEFEYHAGTCPKIDPDHIEVYLATHAESRIPMDPFLFDRCYNAMVEACWRAMK